MPAYFEQGFFVRVPAWHGLGIVLDDYPGRDEAMKLAGHDWDIIESSVRFELETPQGRVLRKAEGFKAHRRSDTDALLHVSKESFERIPNSVPYDFAEILLDLGFKYETGITLKGGALNALTLLLDEPVTVNGDNSSTLPYLGLAWAHDGSAALTGNPTSIRRVCANTVTASEAEGAKLGVSFSIRHTKNWRDRVEDAKRMMKGTRENIDVYVELMNELGELHVTPEQRDLFVSAIIGDRDGLLSSNAATSQRVKNNIERERGKILSLFMGQTIPEAHALTGYGLHLAGVEYFDHLRGFKSQDSYVKRTLLTHNPAKANLTKTIREVIAA